MKKIIVFTLLLTLSAASFSQQTNPSPVLTKQDYLQKSKKQKSNAWILLGGGAVFVIIGGAIAGSSTVDELGAIINSGTNDETWVAGGIFVITGGVAMLGSIPLFIAAARNKRKAMSMTFKNETIPQIQKSSFVCRQIPSLALKISL